MKTNSRNPKFSFPKWQALLLLVAGCSAAWAEDFTSLCAERTAIEQVYYNHRTGTKPSFEQALPRSTLESLVRLNLKKEAVLREHYGVTITPALLDAEVRRINTTTRAPKMLAEIKAALGNDPEKFANAYAKPILVEHLLREKFDNDDALHLPQRQACERVRAGLLAAKTNGATAAQLFAQFQRARTNAVTETTWQLTPRPAETQAPPADELEIKKRFGPGAQILSRPRPAAGADRKFYFEDLPPGLQRVLRVQLRLPGDVSAVIETPGGFLLYLCKARTEETLGVATLSLPKRRYEQWLDEQRNMP